MLPEPLNKPHTVATDSRPFDLGYASLYSRWVELDVYLFPAAILLGALFGFIAFKAGLSTDTSLAAGGITMLVVRPALLIASQLDPIYQDWKSVRTKTTAHVFTADGVELATFLPARNLEGPAEAELIRKFIRKNIADSTLRG